MSEKKRQVCGYVTKASLRHITANDEASSLSGDFIIAHHSPALLKRKRTEGRKKERSFTSIQMVHTHTRVCMCISCASSSGCHFRNTLLLMHTAGPAHTAQGPCEEAPCAQSCCGACKASKLSSLCRAPQQLWAQS